MNAPDVVPVERGTAMRGGRGWLFGAYTLLFLWGMAFLILLFTNRLPG